MQLRLIFFSVHNNFIPFIDFPLIQDVPKVVLLLMVYVLKEPSAVIMVACLEKYSPPTIGNAFVHLDSTVNSAKQVCRLYTTGRPI